MPQIFIIPTSTTTTPSPTPHEQTLTTNALFADSYSIQR